MTQYIAYRTREGQRWDTVAYEVYGDPYGYPQIIEANPVYRAVAVLAAGIVLRIPVDEQSEPTIAPENLPPWKR